MNSGSPPTPAAAQPVRVVLADGQNLVRTSLRHLLSLPAWIFNDVYGVRLTAREREVLKLVAAGHPNKEIAQRCAVSEETVKHPVTHIFDKVGVSSRAQLVSVVSQCGLSAAV